MLLLQPLISARPGSSAPTPTDLCLPNSILHPYSIRHSSRRSRVQHLSSFSRSVAPAPIKFLRFERARTVYKNRSNCTATSRHGLSLSLHPLKPYRVQLPPECNTSQSASNVNVSPFSPLGVTPETDYSKICALRSLASFPEHSRVPEVSLPSQYLPHPAPCARRTARLSMSRRFRNR